jgi:hypothetical protein
VTARTPVQKNVFMGKIPTSYLPNLFEFSGAANGRLRLVD